MAKKRGKMYENYHGKLPMTVYVNPEVKKQIVEYAAIYGCSLTGMASMAIFTGLKRIKIEIEK